MSEAVILAGGLGTRLKELFPDLPKTMVPVNGKPFLFYILKNLAKNKFKRVIISVSFLSSKIINYFGREYFNLKIDYVVEKKPLGTGGATKLALENCKEDHIYLINGDTYLDFEHKKIEKLWKESRCPIIVCKFIKNVSRYGTVKVVDGRIKSFEEKTFIKKGFVNTGLYVFKKNQFLNFKMKPSFSLEKDFLVSAVKNDIFKCFLSKRNFIDIGIPKDYFKAANLFMQSKF
jgi:D-glycero-alpha-D-manno-heptose 1-phosphate guanylyltransferase